MTLVQKLKAESLRLRKEHNPIAASITFVLSEIERVGKNDGNRVTTEDEATKVVQKIVATLRDNLNYALRDLDKEHINQQLAILETVLPQMVGEAEIWSAIQDLMFDPNFIVNYGSIMKSLRARFGALIDMKYAGKIVEEYLA